MTRVEALKRAYRLEPHPEGGWFSEVYTAPFADAKGRALAGSIYFLLAGDDVSHFHQIDCDEVWYYHEGAGLRVTMIGPDGAVSSVALGPDMDAGQVMMAVVPAGTIFALECPDKTGWCFVSCMTTPRFSYASFRLNPFAEIAALCPDRAEALRHLAIDG